MIGLRGAVLIAGFLSVVTGGPLLLYANRKNVCLVDVEAAQTNSTVIVSGLEDAAAVDFVYGAADGPASMVYWTDTSQETIKRVTLATSPSLGTPAVDVVVSTGLISPDGVACDWIGRKLYWTDSGVKRIEVSDLEGRMRKVLFWDLLDQPRAIAVFPQRGLMFWTDWGEEPKIERAGMDGDPASRQVIISTRIFWPNGLTVDYNSGRLYWADGKYNYIHSSNLDGSDRTEVVSDSRQLPHPFSLTLFGESLYWTDWNTHAIYTCNRSNGANSRTVVTNLFSPMDIHVYHPSRQPAAPNPCGANNGGCTHLCLMSPTAPYYQCACPTGVRRLADNRSCADGASSILLLVRRTDLRWVSLDTADFTDVVLDIRNVRHAIAVEYDPVDQYVYWTDDEVRSIRRAFLDGTGEEVIIDSEIDRPDGVAVDWVARNIYWTDTGTDRIEVARLNGSHRKVVISEKLLEPRAIVVDPLDGRMYWSDWGDDAKIERANLDGSARIVLVNTSLGWPNGLTIDYIERRIYWGDAKLDRIETSALDGSERRILVGSDLPHIFGLTLLGDYLYWTDWIEREVGRVHKHNGTHRTVILEQLPDLMGIKAVNISAVEGENTCSVDNGGCSQLCLYRAEPRGHVCGCANGYELMVDGYGCVVPEAFLLYLHRNDIRRISLEASLNDAAIPLDGVSNARGLDYDNSDSRIYWTDVGFKSINRAFVNGSVSEHVVDFDLESPESVVVDWVAHNLYWVDSGTRRVEMSHIDGSSRRVIVWQNVQPRTLVVDPTHGYLYWSNWMSKARVERSALDGADRMTYLDDLGRVSGLAIDFDSSRLYWASLDRRNIESVDLATGGDRHVVMSGLIRPYGLTQFRNFIYWTDQGTHTIERAHKVTGQNRTRIRMNADVMDISVIHNSRHIGWNECAAHNGRCSNLCVASPNASNIPTLFHCICPTHYELADDNRTCLPPETFLLFSQRTSISRMLVNAAEAAPDVRLPIHGLKSVRALDFDPVELVAYWIENQSNTIRRARDTAARASVFVEPVEGHRVDPYDLAVDPYGRMVYWTDTEHKVIAVTRTDGEHIGTVVDDVDARSIALAPEEGLLFWTTAGRSQRIERAAMDGTTRMTLFNTGIGSLGPIAVDTESRQIYWADLDLKRIEAGDYDGGHRRIVVDGDIRNPSGMYVFGDQLYWTDRSTSDSALERVNKVTGRDRERLYSGRSSSSASRLTDVVVVKRLNSSELLRSLCGHNNGGCSHLCVVYRSGSSDVVSHRCSCPFGLMLSANGHTCSLPPTCGPDKFACNNGYCIPATWRCDSYADCEDESDELNCTQCSTSSLFLCHASGQCMHQKFRCDGRTQCLGGADEENCPPCTDDQFLCRVEQICVDQAVVCNGHEDCGDGSDELNCKQNTLPTTVPSSSSNIHYAIGIGVIGSVLVLAFAVLLLICMCRQKSRQREDPVDRNIVLVTKLSSPSAADMSDNYSSLIGRPHGGIIPPPPSATSLFDKQLDDDSDSPLYDRDHITGASSSSLTTTAAQHYPKETLNPPPSPATERSLSVGAGRRFVDSAVPPPKRRPKVRTYSKRRRKHRVPPTTPCSTDVCEDSESHLDDFGHRCAYYAGAVDCRFESDPLCPPPPTPRSHCLSEELSCRSSPPSTECSFFVSVPPPPPSTFSCSD